MPKQNINSDYMDYLNCSQEEIFDKLRTSQKGLTEDEVLIRLEEYGYNETAKKKQQTIILQILSKFVNPLVIVLLIIAGFSLFFSEKISAILVIIMACISVFLSFIRNIVLAKKQRNLANWYMSLLQFTEMVNSKK